MITFHRAVAVARFTFFHGLVAADRCAIVVVIGVAPRRTTTVIAEAFADGGDGAHGVTGGGISRLTRRAARIGRLTGGGAVHVTDFAFF